MARAWWCCKATASTVLSELHGNERRPIQQGNRHGRPRASAGCAGSMPWSPVISTLYGTRLPRMSDAETSTYAPLRRLWPYAAACGALFSVAALLVAVAGVLDLQRSLEELPRRFLYSALMSTAFSAALGIAAYCSFNAAIKLRRSSPNPTDPSFAAALNALTQFMHAFFAWVLVFTLILLVAIALPAY